MSEGLLITSNFAEIEKRISQAAERTGRSLSNVRLVAVSKKQPISKMLAYQELVRQRQEFPIFGENYVQEFKKKRELLAPGCVMHLIGPLQFNKVRDAVELFDVIESVHSRDILCSIDSEAKRVSKRQSVFLQVNISSDGDKHGFSKEEALEVLSNDAPVLTNTDICGLMTITRFYENPADARPDFREMKELHSKSKALLEKSGHKLNRWDLSMGMSGDFEIAIEEGATLIRIGTALFGER